MFKDPVEALACGNLEPDGSDAMESVLGGNGLDGRGIVLEVRRWPSLGELLRKLGLSGLVFVETLAEFAAEEAVRNRPGDRGTLHKLVSSGRSSSESWNSASISFAVFLGRELDDLRIGYATELSLGSFLLGIRFKLRGETGR